VPEGARILTHCNAGALATAGYGTALGVIRAAAERGKGVEVFADETRPFLQGARLTAWELVRDGIPTTVITDNMAGALMRQGLIQFVVVGADRIAANGDVANKIGTYTVAVLAREHGIPFYVAAPLSTVDLATADGSGIPIEERSAREVTHVGNVQVAPASARVRNPAFDVTPAKLVTGIITERASAGRRTRRRFARRSSRQGRHRVVGPGFSLLYVGSGFSRIHAVKWRVLPPLLPQGHPNAAAALGAPAVPHREEHASRETRLRTWGAPSAASPACANVGSGFSRIRTNQAFPC